MALDPNFVNVEGVDLVAGDAIKFLDEMGMNESPCPICASDLWVVSLGPGHGLYPAIQTTGGKPADGSAYRMPLFTTECSKCGYTRLHSLLKLARWKESKEVGEDP